MNEAIFGVLSMMNSMYMNDTMVRTLIPVYAADHRPGTFDPRVITGGVGSIAAKNAPVFLDAPVVILVACDDRAIGGPQIQAGICGQNMNLAAKSLGLGCCWIGFSQVIEIIAVACHADNQVAVKLRMLLSLTERFGINHIELYVVPVKAEIASYQRCQLLIASLVLKKLR
jgi:hypothetical protein